jgi:hypothetical protein
LPHYDLLSPQELPALDAAIAAVPDAQLRAKAGLLLMRQGVLPEDVVRLRRSGFAGPEPGFPAQVTGPCMESEEITILPEDAAAAVTRLLHSHDHALIIPGMTTERLRHLLAERLEAAGLPPVPALILRSSVRLHAGAAGGVL